MIQMFVEFTKLRSLHHLMQTEYREGSLCQSPLSKTVASEDGFRLELCLLSPRLQECVRSLAWNAAENPEEKQHQGKGEKGKG
jgi:hypothetical protein